MKKQYQYTIGEKVHYTSFYGDRAENGRVKAFSNDGNGLFIVFRCKDWMRFKDCPAVYVPVDRITSGWIEMEKIK